MRAPAWLAVLSSLAGCGSSVTGAAGGDASLADGPGRDGSGPDADAGLGDGGIPRDDSPITERPSRGTYQCRIDRGRTDHSPRNWGMSRPVLVKTSGGQVFLARLELMTDSPIMEPPPQLVISSMDLAGSFGPPTAIALANPLEGTSLAAAPRGDGFVVAWTDGPKLRLAGFDGGGQLVLAPRDVLTADGAGDLQLAAGADGNFGLVFSSNAGTGSRDVRFAVIDPTGTVRAAQRTLTAMPGMAFASPAPAIAATAAGYAMIWRDPAPAAGGIDFASASLAGAEVVARHRVSAPVEPGLVVGGVSGFEAPDNALLSNGDGFLAAWIESRRSESSGAGSVVRLARLDASGNRQGEAASLRRFQADVDEVEPTLIAYGDAVAVLWARGSHTYVCAGCVPDHRIDLLLVDPTTLVPVSDVLSLSNGGDPRAGGLLRHGVATVGTSLLTTYLLTFHTNAKPGSAAFGCSKN